MQVAFYGSTPNYSFIFEQLGFEGTTDRILERQRARDLAGMAAEVSDELLDHFVVTGLRNELADRILERYDELATRVVSCSGTSIGRTTHERCVRGQMSLEQSPTHDDSPLRPVARARSALRRQPSRRSA